LQQAKEAAMKKQQHSRFKALLRKRNSGNDALEAKPEPKQARENFHSKISMPIIIYKKVGITELITFLYNLNLRFAFCHGSSLDLTLGHVTINIHSEEAILVH
jgi:hypothetical protein